jgi:NTP pyrophosphatase (non-canonical NTP hydrolase)
MEDLFNQIRDLIKLAKLHPDGYTRDESFMAQVEEVGEVSTALRVEQGTKKRNLKEGVKEECVDVIFCALELMFMSGATNEFVLEYLQTKINKRRKKIEKKS